MERIAGLTTDAPPDGWTRVDISRTPMTRRQSRTLRGGPGAPCLAFIIDMIIIAIPVIFAAMFIFLVRACHASDWAGVCSGCYPAAVIWALFYYGYHHRRPGLRHHWHAGHRYHDAHLVRRAWLFPAWRGPRRRLLDASALTPLDPAGRLVQCARRLLHDMLLGTVVINNAARAALRGPACRVEVQSALT